MHCWNCGSELSEAVTLCGSCGTAQSANTPVRDPKAIKLLPIAGTGESPTRKLWTAIRIGIAVAVAILSASSLYSFSDAAGIAGYGIGTLFFPFLIAYAITRNKRGWYRFSYWFLGITILLLAISAPKGIQSLSHHDLLTEMTGTQPIESDLSVSAQKQLAVSRAIFSDLQADHKSYNEHVRALTPDIQWLFSNDSFTGRTNIKKALNVVDQMMALDRENFADVESIPNVVKLHLDQSNLSAQQKLNFLQGFYSSFNGSKTLTQGKEMIDAEQAWASATTDLYKYAYLHVDEIHVENGQLLIKNDHTRDQFNAKLTRTNELRKKFLFALKQFNAARNAYLKKEDVTAAQLGFSN